MKIRNKSDAEAKVLPNDGSGSFAVAPGAESPELSKHAAEDLVASFPSVWELADVKPTKKLKKEI